MKPESQKSRNGSQAKTLRGKLDPKVEMAQNEEIGHGGYEAMQLLFDDQILHLGTLMIYVRWHKLSL